MELNKVVINTYTQFVLLCLVVLKAEQLSDDGGGWSSNSDFRLQDEGPCNIDVLDGSSLSHQQFIERYAYGRPVILRGLTDNTKFRSLCSKSSLLGEYGGRRVRLSTANTYSYRKVDVPFQEYVDVLLRPQSADALGSDTLYFFGDNNFTEWQSLFDQYESPPYVLPHTSGAYSFGIAGHATQLEPLKIRCDVKPHTRPDVTDDTEVPYLSAQGPGTGVPFHWHGPGYSEVIYGRKRWFLYPPDREPHFHPNRTTLSWVMETYPHLPEDEAPLECTIRPGEVLYFPDRWWHATLNLDTSVFISTFLG